MFAMTYAQRVGLARAQHSVGLSAILAADSFFVFAIRKGEIHVADTGTKKTGSGPAPQRCMGKAL